MFCSCFSRYCVMIDMVHCDDVSRHDGDDVSRHDGEELAPVLD